MSPSKRCRGSTVAYVIDKIKYNEKRNKHAVDKRIVLTNNNQMNSLSGKAQLF